MKPVVTLTCNVVPPRDQLISVANYCFIDSLEFHVIYSKLKVYNYIWNFIKS